ncbi:Zn-ribbon domain-containing OB-fold protein [Hydrogenophaga sp. 2FB]|uniref:Zn-ribbon domain-containing OB-fold protein n=1 Tax=Hydrogenophaga sp. 2FB TaxID=2502187 RepID=UPI0010F70FBC|nr:Zn-ribbon domain-containing OB-fold protein [Hydrogenophaga sp. 2FB]
MTTIFQDRPLKAPMVDAATEAFWRGAAEGRLLIKQCTACGKPHWYPRSLCPYCMSERLEWRPSAGLGTIYSVSVTRRAGPTPYAIAYVRLDEEVTLLTNIVDCDLDSLRIGDRVKLCFKPAEDGQPIPMFTPD